MKNEEEDSNVQMQRIQLFYVFDIYTLMKVLIEYGSFLLIVLVVTYILKKIQLKKRQQQSIIFEISNTIG